MLYHSIDIEQCIGNHSLFDLAYPDCSKMKQCCSVKRLTGSNGLLQLLYFPILSSFPFFSWSSLNIYIFEPILSAIFASLGRCDKAHSQQQRRHWSKFGMNLQLFAWVILTEVLLMPVTLKALSKSLSKYRKRIEKCWHLWGKIHKTK